MFAVFSQLSADSASPTAVNAALARMLNEQLSLRPGCDVFADVLTSDMQQLYETRLRQAADAQPAATKKAKQQAPDADTAEATDLSIQVCSMDGSSVRVEVARDATISDVKVCIVKISKPPPGTVIQPPAAWSACASHRMASLARTASGKSATSVSASVKTARRMRALRVTGQNASAPSPSKSAQGDAAC